MFRRRLAVLAALAALAALGNFPAAHAQVLYVAEFADIAKYSTHEPPQLVAMPPLAEQTVAIGASSAAVTNAFGANTHVIRVHVDKICSIAIGTAPTATATNMRLAANATEYFAVIPGQKIAVIQNN